MTKRKFMRGLYNALDSLKLRGFAQRVSLKLAVMEIEDED